MLQLFTLLEAPAPKSPTGGTMTLIFILLLILIFYFFMIRPQQKKQKQIEKFRSSLKRGDKVVTIGGIHGKITEIRDNTFIIEIADNISIQIEKTAVAIDDSQLKAQSQKSKEEKK